MLNIMDKIEEYNCIQLKFNKSDELSHFLFMKKYRSEKPSFDKPVGKTLHVLNIPPYVSEDNLMNLFGVAGDIDKITLLDSYEKTNNKYQTKSDFFKDDVSNKFKFAYIVYKKSGSVDMLLKLKELPPLELKESPIVTGLAKWRQFNNERFIDPEKMQEEIDAYMKNYDKLKKAEEEGNEEADDDGWVTVTRKGANAGFKQKESVISKLEQKIRKQKSRAKNLKNFYTFELRESKKQHLIGLRKRFEEDKRKMDKLKQNRTFKPF